MPKQYIILSASMGIINCDVCVVCMYGVCVCVYFLPTKTCPFCSHVCHLINIKEDAKSWCNPGKYGI